MRGDARNYAFDVLIDRRKIDCWFSNSDAERLSFAEGMGVLARSEQRFGGNTAVIEAVAPHLAFLDQDNRGSHLRSTRSDRQSTGTRTNDAQINFQHFRHRRRLLELRAYRVLS